MIFSTGSQHSLLPEADAEQALLETAVFRPTWIPARSYWTDYLPLAFWLIGQLRPNTLVELGTAGGASYMGMCQAVRDWGLATRCYAVDTWEGDAHTGRYSERYYQRLAEYNEFCYRDFSTLLRCTFDQALDSFSDQSIDLLHIDGYHTYQAVRHDFDTWLPKVAPGGIIMLHDIDMHRKDFGVYQLWDELVERFPHTWRMPGRAGLGLIQLPYSQQDKPIVLPTAGSRRAQLLVNWLSKLGNDAWERTEQITQQKQALDNPPPPATPQAALQRLPSLAAQLLPAHTWPGRLARSIYRRLRPLPASPSDPSEPELPFPEPVQLHAPQNYPPLYHFYHVFADGNWQPILIEHLATLKKSGLSERLSTLHIGCVGHPENRRRVRHWLEALNVPFEMVTQADTGYEQVTLDSLYQFSLANQGWVLYAHTKGAANENDTVFRHRWRRSMSFFTISCWSQTITHLDTCDAVGCHWLTAEEYSVPIKSHYPFFGGNFWWARLDYLSRLGPPTTTSRYHAESWIGQDPLIRIHDLRPGWPHNEIFIQVPPVNGDGAP